MGQYKSDWYHAIQFSCILHFIIFFSLVIVLSHLEKAVSFQKKEEIFISIDDSEVSMEADSSLIHQLPASQALLSTSIVVSSSSGISETQETEETVVATSAGSPGNLFSIDSASAQTVILAIVAGRLGAGQARVALLEIVKQKEVVVSRGDRMNALNGFLACIEASKKYPYLA